MHNSGTRLWNWLHRGLLIAQRPIRWPPRRICREHLLLAIWLIVVLIMLLIHLAHPVLARDAWHRSVWHHATAVPTTPVRTTSPITLGLAHQHALRVDPPLVPTAHTIPPQAHTPDQAAPPPSLPLADPPRVYREPVAEIHRTTNQPVLPLTVIVTATTIPPPVALVEPLPVRVVPASVAVNASGGHDVRGVPSLTGGQVDTILARYGSPALGTGPIWEELSRQYGIDTAYALSFFMTESTAATDPHWSGRKPDGSTTHNIGNIVCAGYPRCYGRWRDYATWEEGIADWYRLIAEEYINARGAVTVEQIVPIYAPAFENDVPRYIAGVVRRVAAWQGIPPDQWPPMPPPRVVVAAGTGTETPVPDTPAVDRPSHADDGVSTEPAAPAETTTGVAETPPQPGAVRMPDLVGMTLEDAYLVLSEQGIPVGVVDIQGRDHLPTLFDQVDPNTVVSSMPGWNEWVLSGEAVVLGVRAPDNVPLQAEPAESPPIEQPPTETPTTLPDDLPTVTRERVAQPIQDIPIDEPESSME